MSTINAFWTEWLNYSLNKTKDSTDPYAMVSYPLIYSNNNKTTYTYGTNNGIISYTYDKLNGDKKTIKTISKYYYYKILDKWLYKELLPLLGFVEIVDDKPRLLTNLNNFDGEKLLNESSTSLEKKAEYLEKVMITKDLVKHVLRKIIDKYNISWTKLEDFEYEIKKYFFNYLKDKLEDVR